MSGRETDGGTPVSKGYRERPGPPVDGPVGWEGLGPGAGDGDGEGDGEGLEPGDGDGDGEGVFGIVFFHPRKVFECKRKTDRPSYATIQRTAYRVSS